MKKKRCKEEGVRETPAGYFTEEELVKLIEETLPSLVSKRPELKLKLRNLFNDLATKSDVVAILEELKKQREDWNRRFEEMREDTNKRFEEIHLEMKAMREDWNRRFEAMREDTNKRFEEIHLEMREMREDWNRRFEEMREDTNKRFEEIHLEMKAMREDWNRKFEAMREDTNKRFAEIHLEMKEMRDDTNRRFEGVYLEMKAIREDMNKRFEEVYLEMKTMREDFRDAIEKTARALSSKMDTVGSRWGIMAESSMRELLNDVLSKVGFTAIKWKKEDKEGKFFLRPRTAEIDILVKDTKIIAIEVKSSLTKGEVDDFERCVRFYEEVERKKVDEKVILAIHPYAGVREYASELGIRVISEPEEINR